MPGFGAEAPLYFYYVPQEERQDRCQLTSDTCIVDGQHFFVRGCIEIPVVGADEPFIWGVWVSLSPENYKEFCLLLEKDDRGSFGPYFGWLSASLKGYPETEDLKTRVHLRNCGVRPYIELEPTKHPFIDRATDRDHCRKARTNMLHLHALSGCGHAGAWSRGNMRGRSSAARLRELLEFGCHEAYRFAGRPYIFLIGA